MMAANQEATRAWWDEERHHFELYVSQVVLYEASCGDPKAAARRLETVSSLPEPDVTPEVEDLAERLLAEHALPNTANDDALHIALAAAHGMEYLLTWNCNYKQVTNLKRSDDPRKAK